MTKIADEEGVKFEWTEMTFLQVQAGNIALLIFALGAAARLFGLGGKMRKLAAAFGRHPGGPLCMLAAVEGMVLVHLPVNIFVQIGLLIAHRPGEQECDFDRGICATVTQQEGQKPMDAARQASSIAFARSS